MRIEAATLEEIYTKAALKLECSVNEIDIEIIQAPTEGVLGFFKKNAIVEVSKKSSSKISPVSNKPTPQKEYKQDYKKDTSISSSNKMISEMEGILKILLDKSCFDVELIEVKELKDGEVYIQIDGKDAPLMIGKEGYRYKALSYLLYNMFKAKFNVSIKLEVAQFLEKQENYIDNYLIIVKEKIEKFGRANTRVLDGVLLKLALEKLRASYKDKYVGIKTNRDGEKYIVINNFNTPKR